MSSLYKMFGNDESMELNGVNLKYGDSVFIMRRAGGSNHAYQNDFRKRMRPLRAKISADIIDQKEFNAVQIQSFAKTVAIGWENVTDRDGNPMPFNEQNFIKLMTDLPDLWEQVLDACTNVANFRAETISEDAESLGNS